MVIGATLCVIGAWLLAAGATAAMAIVLLRRSRTHERLLRAMERMAEVNSTLALRRPVMVVERLEDGGVRTIGLVEPPPPPPPVTASQGPLMREEPAPPDLARPDFDETQERF